MTYERLIGMGAAPGCTDSNPLAVLNDPAQKPDDARRLELQGCIDTGHSHQNFNRWCCPPLRVQGCPPGGLKYYLQNPGETMNNPCFDTGIVQRDYRGVWGRVWCCPPQLRIIPQRRGGSMITEGEQAYNQCVDQEGSVPAFEHPLTGKPSNVADMDCYYSGRLVTEDHRTPVDAAQRATALREMCCQPRSGMNLQPVPSTLSTPEAPPVLFSNGNGNGAAVQPVQQAGMIPVRLSWTGVAVLGLAGAFFWWFWKRFLPGMHAVAERDRMRTAAGE
jgi:hypothetical protein